MGRTPIPKQDLIEELVRLADDLDKGPSTTDMAELGQYATGPYKNAFASWNNAKRRAGLSVTKPSKSVSDNELLHGLRQVAGELGTTPTTIQMRQDEDTANPSTYKERFGSWNEAVKAAGLEPNTPGGTARSRGHSEKELIAMLQEFADELDRERAPTARELDRRSKADDDWPCQSTFRNVIGSWSQAVALAGYEPYDQGRGPDESVREEGVDYIPLGRNWKTQRQKAIERDRGVCQHEGCMVSIQDHEDAASDKGILVHHLVPRRRFYFDDRVTVEDDANQLPNLVTLCYKHHADWEHDEDRARPDLDLPTGF